MMISNYLMESFEWKTEDWGENRSLILSKSKQDLSKIGILHNFANFIQRKDSQEETREQIVTDFWDPINPKKVPSVIFATIVKKTGLFYGISMCHEFLEQFFDVTLQQQTIFIRELNFAGFFYCNTSFNILEASRQQTRWSVWLCVKLLELKSEHEW